MGVALGGKGQRPGRCSLQVMGLALGWLLPACESPTVVISSEPPATTIYLDGKKVSTENRAEIDLPYYGGILVTGRHLPHGREAAETLYQDLRQVVFVDEPYSPWLYPLDFVLEFLSYPFLADQYQRQVRIQLPERPSVVPPTIPRGVTALRNRARQARYAR